MPARSRGWPADDGVADDVGEADLAAPGAAQVAVDDPAVDLEQLGRDVAEAGGGGDAEARLHVLDDAGGDARGSPRLGGLAVALSPPAVRPSWRPAWRPAWRVAWPRGRRCGARLRRRGVAPLGRPAAPLPAGAGVARRRSRRGRRHVVGVAAVVGEEVAPALAHRARIGEVLLVHLVDEPGVRAQRGGRFGGRWLRFVTRRRRPARRPGVGARGRVGV